jgi:hypothetical protein
MLVEEASRVWAEQEARPIRESHRMKASPMHDCVFLTGIHVVAMLFDGSYKWTHVPVLSRLEFVTAAFWARYPPVRCRESPG